MLLDTNALLWMYEADPRLGPISVGSILESSNACYSAVSVMEIVIKHMLGRVDLPGGSTFPAPLTQMGLPELPFSSRHAAAMLTFPSLARHDPFDRMLLGQARAENMSLLTSDRTLLGLGEPWILDARS
jgi:PIN domain nuclease of toxin-antitoxin system